MSAAVHTATAPRVASVSTSPVHGFTKPVVERIVLLAGLGVEGDAHCGTTVKHRSRVRRDPTQPNLRQVHLVHAELFDELAAQGFVLAPGAIGENITTRGIDLLALPVDTVLQVGPAARVRLTGLRNPCHQLDDFQPGLMAATLGRHADGSLLRKAGVMAVVEQGGVVGAGDAVVVALPPLPHRPMEKI